MRHEWRVRRTRRGDFQLRIPAQEREVLRGLPGQLRALLGTDDPALERLFPPARTATVESFFVTREQRATFRQAPGKRALRPGTRLAVPLEHVLGPKDRLAGPGRAMPVPVNTTTSFIRPLSVSVLSVRSCADATVLQLDDQL